MRGEYYLCDADPGQGRGGAPLTLVGAALGERDEGLAAALLHHQPPDQ